MSKPKVEITRESYLRDTDFLHKVMLQLRSAEGLRAFLRDVLTPSELRMFKRRWYIACLLDEGYDVRQVAREAKVSTGTVMRVKSAIFQGRGGLRQALDLTRKERIESEPSPIRPQTPLPARNLAEKTRIVFG